MFFENKFFELIHFFWTLGTKTSVFGPKLLDGFVRTAFNVSRGDFWVNCFFFKLYHRLDCFPTAGRTLCNIGSKTFEKMVKLQSTRTTKFFSVKFVFWRKYLHLQFFRALIKNFADLCGKTFHPVSKTAFNSCSGDLLA